jgi:diguanylate cyclase (GGDEF)-like protein
MFETATHSVRLPAVMLTDTITGLPKGTKLQALLRGALAQAADNGQQVAVISLDVITIKEVRQALGQRASHKVMARVGGRLARAAGDDRRVSRLDGQTFIVVHPGIAELEQAGELAERLKRAVARPMEVEGRELVLSTRVGIAVSPDKDADPETLICNAEMASSITGDSMHFYSSRLRDDAHRLLALESSLYRSIERNELELVFQPRVRLGSLAIVGAEALLRWRHPKLGSISPLEFIPVAERSGFIVELGAWVVQQCATQYEAWLHDGLRLPVLSVNVNSRQFQRDDFAGMLESAGVSRLPRGGQLELELTETAMIDTGRTNIRKLEKLKELGLRLAIDDFGTGYSSLSYLKQFPVDVVKIDRSFIEDLTTDASSPAIVQSILSMARGLGIDVVAEGVEREDQLALLEQLGCEEIQGFLFSKPVSARELAKLLRAGRLRPSQAVYPVKGRK